MECEGCGYTDKLSVGCGFAGVIYHAMRCPACRRVVGAQVTTGRKERKRWDAGQPPPNAFSGSPITPRCPSCRGPVEAWGRGDEGANDTTARLPALPLRRLGPCPRCGASVALIDVGIWD